MTMCVVYACWHAHDVAPQKPEEGFRSKEAGAIEDCRPSSIGARNWTRILSQSSMCPKLLSISLAPKLIILKLKLGKSGFYFIIEMLIKF